MPDCAAAVSSDASSRQSLLRLLIRRMAEGDQAAAAAFYDESCGVLYALALRIVRNQEDAEEVLHDVYCRAWRGAAAYDESRGSVMSWLILMTRSVAIDLLRSKRRMPGAFAADDNAPELESAECSPEAQAATSEERVRIGKALGSLPYEQRQSIELAFFTGFSHSELAAHLNVPLGTVKTRIRTGLLRLRELLEASGA